MKIKRGTKVVAEGDNLDQCLGALRSDKEYKGALFYPHTDGDEIHVRFPEGNTYGEAVILKVDE